MLLSVANLQVVLVVKNLPANAGDIRDLGFIPGLGRSLEEGMATHSRILAWRIPWTEDPGGLQSIVLHTVGHDWARKHTHTCTHTYMAVLYTNNYIPVGICQPMALPVQLPGLCQAEVLPWLLQLETHWNSSHPHFHGSASKTNLPHCSEAWCPLPFHYLAAKHLLKQC